MTVTLVGLFVLVLCVSGFGLASYINEAAIVDAVNSKLPADDQFNPLGWGPSKTLRLHHAYRRLYPEGRLLKRQAILHTLMLLCLVSAAALLGFGFLPAAWIGMGGLVLNWLLYWRK
jgi:hypothetical protein